MDEDTVLLVILAIVGMMIVVLVPFATIWSLNIIFGLEIGYNLKTWVAAAWVAAAWLVTILQSINRKPSNQMGVSC